MFGLCFRSFVSLTTRSSSIPGRKKDSSQGKNERVSSEPVVSMCSTCTWSFQVCICLVFVLFVGGG